MNLTLLTDLYQLTMARGYHALGRHEQPAVFHLFFRRAPFAGGYAIAAGLQGAVDLIRDFRFEDDDLAYLATIEGNDGQPLFPDDFLAYLGGLKLTVDVDAVPEGTAVFAHEPLLRITGPILQGQLLETALLNVVNFQTLIATKAARVCDSARTANQQDTVLEFGLRRAQGPDGALTASRAAYLGGCHATSNVLAGKTFGIPVRGTHAHSWVMSFDDEMESFDAYAKALPNNCVFLVDTYDTLRGVDHAIAAGHKLRERGHELAGIRLDSGDLAWLSIEARKKLDDAGFPDAKIVASNDLNEALIRDLKQQGARIAVWGVGTQLATAYDQPALGGVYKLAAMQEPDGTWTPKVKLSEDTVKTSIPGRLQVRRLTGPDGRLLGDQIVNELDPPAADDTHTLVDPADPTRRKTVPDDAIAADLLVPVFRNGQPVRDDEPLAQLRERAIAQRGAFDPTVRRIQNPHRYPVGLAPNLHALRQQMIEAARGADGQV